MVVVRSVYGAVFSQFGLPTEPAGWAAAKAAAGLADIPTVVNSVLVHARRH